MRAARICVASTWPCHLTNDTLGTQPQPGTSLTCTTAFTLLRQRAAPYSMRNAASKRYTIDNNVGATHNVLCAIVESGLDIHLVHLGTMGVYGYGNSGGEIPEVSPCCGHTPSCLKPSHRISTCNAATRVFGTLMPPACVCQCHPASYGPDAVGIHRRHPSWRPKEEDPPSGEPLNVYVPRFPPASRQHAFHRCYATHVGCMACP